MFQGPSGDRGSPGTRGPAGLQVNEILSPSDRELL